MIHHKELVAEPIWASVVKDRPFAEFPVHPAGTALSCLFAQFFSVSYLSGRNETGGSQATEIFTSTPHIAIVLAPNHYNVINATQSNYFGEVSVSLSSHLDACIHNFVTQNATYICVLSYKTFSFSLLWCGDHTVVSLNQGIQ